MSSPETYRKELILSMASNFTASMLANPNSGINPSDIVRYAVLVAEGLLDAVNTLPPAERNYEIN